MGWMAAEEDRSGDGGQSGVLLSNPVFGCLGLVEVGREQVWEVGRVGRGEDGGGLNLSRGGNA